MTNRPATAPPKEVPLELRPIDAGYHYQREKEAVKLAKAKENLEAALSSDAVPVAWRVEVEKEGDEIIGPVRLVTGPGESWEIQGVDEDCHEDEAWAKLLCEKHNATLYAHPEDAPRPDKASQGSTVSGGERPEQVGDAPVAKGDPGVVEHHILCRYPTIAEIGCKLCIACGHAVIRGNQYRHAHPEDAPGGPWNVKAHGRSIAVFFGSFLRFTGTQKQCNAVRDVLNRLKGDEK